MSYDVNKNWYYQLSGRSIYLWQLISSGATDTLGGYKILLPNNYHGSQLIYPDETITDGLRIDGTAFVKEFVDIDPNELVVGVNPTLTEETSPSETSHVNLTRMLSLAVVDYLKAMNSDKKGDLDRKEYYMREFWKKVGDNESNKRKTSMTYPSSPYAVR